MKIADLTQDDQNANRGTKRGREAVTRSLQDFGAGRSHLIDRVGNIIAAMKRRKQAASDGITAAFDACPGAQRLRLDAVE